MSYRKKFYPATLDDVGRLKTGASPSVTISTDAVDAQRDTIRQDGLTFRKPLPVLFGHDTEETPVGMTTRIIREPNRTRAEWRWLENDERAARVRNAYEQNALGASIGFTLDDATPNGQGGLDIRRGTVVEFSLVPVPANPDCIRTLKHLGLWARASLPGGLPPAEWDLTTPHGTPTCAKYPRCEYPIAGDGTAENTTCPASDCPMMGAVHEPDHAPLIGRAGLVEIVRDEDVVLEIDDHDGPAVFTESEFRAACEAATRQGLRAVIGPAVEAAVRRHTGRVD